MGTDAWGVDDGWVDNAGTWRAAPEATLGAIHSTLGASMDRAQGGEAPGRPVWIVRPGSAERLLGPCTLELEDGTDLGEVAALPGDLPLGLHALVPLDGGPSTTLIVSPGRCHLPSDLRTWGVAMQVPTTRSHRGWGIGDLADVRAVASWLARLGAGALALSPLHAPTPGSSIQPSPYYPSSRRWRSPLLIRVEEVPGAASAPEVVRLAAEARAAAADAGRTVDRDAVWRRQRAALELVWASRSVAADDELRRWRAAQGSALEGWARFCALADRHSSRWSTWPRELRHPDGDAVATAAVADHDRVAFHAWLQLLVDEQLARANVGDVRLIQDLAIGVDPEGADAWMLQDLLALDMSVGAPPDDFAPQGQGWGLPPFVPWRLRDAGYRPFAELLRASMARGGGLRVDHVMGLSRLFWIPNGCAPADGTYVRFAGRELLEVLALESARAGAVVVGEDLGTVEEGFRHELNATGVLSTRLVWFEDEPPEQYPRDALAMVTTHDLPTIAGIWTGADEAELDALRRPTPADERGALRQRLDRLVELEPDAPAGAAIDAVHRRLGRSAAVLALATLEDVCEVATRPNVPGTMTERSNWSTALPLLVEELVEDERVAHHLAQLAAGRDD
ncbi:MAG: 4-alpha-glucanotransferase [Acidimicrobiales bacterium]